MLLRNLAESPVSLSSRRVCTGPAESPVPLSSGRVCTVSSGRVCTGPVILKHLHEL